MFAFVLLGLVSSVLQQEIGCEERLKTDLLLCWVGRKTLTQLISVGSLSKLSREFFLAELA